MKSDCDDINILKQDRDALVINMENVTSFLERLTTLLESTETENRFYERYSEVERDHYQLIKGAESIRELDFESMIKRFSVLKNEYQTNKNKSCGRRCHVEDQIEIMDKEAQVKVDIEKRKIEMERIQTEMELYMTEAKYEAIVKSEREETPFDIEREFDIPYIDKQKWLETYLQTIQEESVPMSLSKTTCNQNNASNATAQQFISASSIEIAPTNTTCIYPQPSTTSMVSQNQNTPHIIQDDGAEQLNLQRLPQPEPSIFTDNPLHYTGWKTAFQMLIEHRNIPAMETKEVFSPKGIAKLLERDFSEQDSMTVLESLDDM